MYELIPVERRAVGEPSLCVLAAFPRVLLLASSAWAWHLWYCPGTTAALLLCGGRAEFSADY